jgi:hypothetical protein
MAATESVLIAVRDAYERLCLETPKVQSETEAALALYERAVQAQEAHKKELAELADFLEREGAPVDAPPVTNNVTLSANMQTLMRAKAILSDGKPRRTRELFEDLLRQGQVFTAVNAAQRLSQLLSSSSWFVSDRTRGWSLAKSENPAGAGSSGASESHTDERGKEGT